MRKFFTLLLLTGLLSIAHTSSAQTIFVKILDHTGTLIEGGSTDARHPKEIVATGFGQVDSTCSPISTGSGSGACKGKIGRFILNMTANQSLPLLLKSMMMGSANQSADITFVSGGTRGLEYFKVRMEQVFVTSVSSSTGDAAPPTVQIEIEGVRVGWTYTPQRPDGTLGNPVKFGWDVSRNTAWTGF